MTLTSSLQDVNIKIKALYRSAPFQMIGGCRSTLPDWSESRNKICKEKKNRTLLLKKKWRGVQPIQRIRTYWVNKRRHR